MLLRTVPDRRPSEPEIVNVATHTLPPLPVMFTVWDKGVAYCKKYDIQWVTEYPAESPNWPNEPIVSGTRVTIELEAAYKRGKGSVDEYIEQTAIANPHVTVHFIDPVTGA